MTQANTPIASPKINYRKDYRPADFVVKSLECCFELHPEKTQVYTTLKLTPREGVKLPAVLTLNGDAEAIKLIRFEKDGELVSPDMLKINEEPDTLKILIQPKSKSLSDQNQEFELKIHTEINPKANTALSGLYLSSGVFCTQCEAEGFRRITYFLDRPDVMTRYTTKIIGDKNLYPVLLSNGNLIEQGDLPNSLTPNQHYALWEDPFKKPSYLFALVAGDLKVLKDSFITKSGRKVSLEIYVADETKLTQCHHAMLSLKYAMKWDEEQFDREYDLDTYMIVAVDDFNMGAMENKGLNVFNTKYILAHPKTATDFDFSHVLTVVGHEYFHNWTGNRITCQDWFQLSLKEGLTVFRDQEFTADFYSRTLKRIEEVNIIRSLQFAEDASPMAHPIRPDSYIEMNNFYTVTVYNKGAEVIRMMQLILGKDGFKRGMDLYFARHDGSAVTCEDFIRSMEDANRAILQGLADLTLFRQWYSQSGTPEISVKESFQAASEESSNSFYELNISQFCQSDPKSEANQPSKLFHIPISLALLDSKGQEIHTEVLHLKEASQRFVFKLPKTIQQKPIPSLLRDFSAPVKLKFQYPLEDLIFLASHDPNEFNRWDATQMLFKQKLLADIQLISTQKNLPEKSSYTPYIKAIQAILNSDCDPGLISEAVTLPSERILSELVEGPIDPSAIHEARELFQAAIRSEDSGLFSTWEKIYLTYQQKLSSESEKTSQEINGKLISERQLKNLALSQIIQSEIGEKLALTQLKTAQNMTDQSAAFSIILQSKNAQLRGEASAYFYEKNHREPLTLNKFFQLHASGNYPELIETIKNLASHPDFMFENPNRVYALFVTFATNPYYFHQKDGAGYALLKMAILKLNPINPQVAARLTKTLMNFKRFEPIRANLMKSVLEALKAETLSPDVYEIVHKALA